MTAILENLRVNMFDLPLRVDGPSRDAVVVLAWKGGYGRDTFALAARGDDLRAGWLHVAGFVPRAAL
jgi:hypothetical protein